MIYLWTDGEGWTEHELSETDEMKKRGITVGDGVTVGDGATVCDGAWVGDGATVGARARVGDGVTVGDGATPIIVYILGSRYAVSYWGEDRIDIGCETHTIADWLAHDAEYAVGHGLAPETVAEYHHYIEAIAAIHAAMPDTAKGRAA